MSTAECISTIGIRLSWNWTSTSNATSSSCAIFSLRSWSLTSLEESLGLLAQGFLKGGVGSFLKGTVVSPELRVGVSHSYVVMIQTLGPAYLETNIRVILSHVLELANNTKSGSSHTESVCCRNCVVFILSTVLGRMLREKAQLAACKELVTILAKSSAAADKEESLTKMATSSRLQNQND